MRTGLRWVLGFTLLGSAAALWLPRGHVTLVDARPRAVPSLDQRMPAPLQTAEALPAELEPLSIKPARRDPFVLVPVSAPPRIQAPPPAFAPAPIQAAPPVPPPLLWRYFGAMTTPEGQSLLLLAKPDQSPVAVAAGQPLGDGFAVAGVSAGEVRLRHPAYAEDLVIPIPVPPATER